VIANDLRMDEDPLQLNPFARGQKYDSVINTMHIALAEHLAGINNFFLETKWVVAQIWVKNWIRKNGMMN
jgi:hypothetical protein